VKQFLYVFFLLIYIVSYQHTWNARFFLAKALACFQKEALGLYVCEEEERTKTVVSGDVDDDNKLQNLDGIGVKINLTLTFDQLLVLQAY
jgi:hypothetical protein